MMPARLPPRHSEWLASVKMRVGLGELHPQPYWGFSDLYHKAGTKLLNCFHVRAEAKRERGQEFFRYSTMMVLEDLSLGSVLQAIEEGNLLIDFDARTGHNHGTEFRLRQDHLPDLYARVREVV